ncbi:MAG: S1 RNA-binding domain-containing protein, partial [Bdellovibrionales bacterium]|nr:S1 RNA-binding domain-containing protein [Bdellovibrionales bacterium]
GAFVQILPGKDGLLHVSEFDSDERVEDVHEFFAEGDEVEVRVVGIDGQGKIKLSQKDDETRREKGLDRDRGGRGGDRGRGGRGRDRNDRGGRPPRYNRDRRD